MGLGLTRKNDFEYDPRIILLGHVIKLHLLTVGKLPSLNCRFCIWKMGTIYIYISINHDYFEDQMVRHVRYLSLPGM